MILNWDLKMFWLYIFSVNMKGIRSSQLSTWLLIAENISSLKIQSLWQIWKAFQCDAKCMEPLLTIKIFPLEKTEASFIIKCDTEFVIQPSFGSLKWLWIWEGAPLERGRGFPGSGRNGLACDPQNTSAELTVDLCSGFWFIQHSSGCFCCGNGLWVLCADGVLSPLPSSYSCKLISH